MLISFKFNYVSYTIDKIDCFYLFPKMIENKQERLFDLYAHANLLTNFLDI